MSHRLLGLVNFARGLTKHILVFDSTNGVVPLFDSRPVFESVHLLQRVEPGDRACSAGAGKYSSVFQQGSQKPPRRHEVGLVLSSFCAPMQWKRVERRRRACRQGFRVCVSAHRLSSPLLEGLISCIYLRSPTSIVLTPVHRHILTYTMADSVPVTFSYRSSSANSVEVAGDWDNWSDRVQLSKVPGQQQDGQDLWQATKQLKPATKFQYKYIQNGDDWHTRDDLPTETDGSGNKNNVLESPAAEHATSVDETKEKPTGEYYRPNDNEVGIF